MHVNSNRREWPLANRRPTAARSGVLPTAGTGSKQALPQGLRMKSTAQLILDFPLVKIRAETLVKYKLRLFRT